MKKRYVCYLFPALLVFFLPINTIQAENSVIIDDYINFNSLYQWEAHHFFLNDGDRVAVFWNPVASTMYGITDVFILSDDNFQDFLDSNGTEVNNPLIYRSENKGFLELEIIEYNLYFVVFHDNGSTEHDINFQITIEENIACNCTSYVNNTIYYENNSYYGNTSDGIVEIPIIPGFPMVATIGGMGISIIVLIFATSKRKGESSNNFKLL